PANEVNRWFSASILAAAFWSGAMVGLDAGIAPAEGWLRATFASAALIAPTFFRFAYCYPNPSIRLSHVVLYAVIGTGALFAVLRTAPRYTASEPAVTPAGLVRKAGPLYPTFAAYYVTTIVGALTLLLSKRRKATGATRVQLTYIVLAALFSISGAIITNL